ncbi:hypothetical protein NDN08_001924 [Rhodosorus marinus]|uniref:AMP-dependent synthetase/ligase domain-containing protein n=1 Tax=Rhodosorus marinus TaxID=101924 RepID=A0AAV8UVX3_9RHOD|nr:hypothetical protein NDN08_001924 [Rhodosorus marinus]
MYSMYRVLSVGRRALGNVGIGGWVLKRSGCGAGRTLVRGLAAASGSRIGEIVDLAARTKPLKDAIKYLQTTNDQLLIWTNSDVKKHTDAFANGLLASGFSAGDKIAVWMPTGSIEYTVSILGAAKAGITLVTIDPPEDPTSADLGKVRGALETYKPKGLILWSEYGANDPEQDGITGILSSLFPDKPTERSLRSMFTKSTGIKLSVGSKYPSLEYVFHTGQQNIRGTLNFKNLLLYSSETPRSTANGEEDVLICASSGEKLSADALIASAKTLSRDLKLSSNQDEKEGKAVLRTTDVADGTVAKGLVAAMMSESLFISPSYKPVGDISSETAAREDAVVL